MVTPGRHAGEATCDLRKHNQNLLRAHRSSCTAGATEGPQPSQSAAAANELRKGPGSLTKLLCEAGSVHDRDHVLGRVAQAEADAAFPQGGQQACQPAHARSIDVSHRAAIQDEVPDGG